MNFLGIEIQKLFEARILVKIFNKNNYRFKPFLSVYPFDSQNTFCHLEEQLERHRSKNMEPKLKFYFLYKNPKEIQVRKPKEVFSGGNKTRIF